MRTAIFCILLTATLLHAAHTNFLEIVPNTIREQAVQPDQHKIDKRFISTKLLMGENDLPLRRRRPRPPRFTEQTALASQVGTLQKLQQLQSILQGITPPPQASTGRPR